VFANIPRKPSSPWALLGLTDPDFTSAAERLLRQQGWRTRTSADGPALRALARAHRPDLVVLAADLPLESGWLTCRKLADEFPGLPVVLVAAEATQRLTRYADFVGAAALVESSAGLAALLENRALLSL
jgi:DNA-binding response OmpR family regulator